MSELADHSLKSELVVVARHLRLRLVPRRIFFFFLMLPGMADTQFLFLFCRREPSAHIRISVARKARIFLLAFSCCSKKTHSPLNQDDQEGPRMGDDIVEKIKLAKMEVERIKAEIKKNKEEMNDTTRTFVLFLF